MNPRFSNTTVAGQSLQLQSQRLRFLFSI